MIWWIIGISVWFIGWFIAIPFFKKYIENGPCGDPCDQCEHIKPCSRVRVLLAFICWPIFVFCCVSYKLCKFVTVPTFPLIRKFHDWELGLLDKAKNSSGKREEKKKEKEEETIKTLKIQNRVLLKRIAKLNKYGRPDVLDV